MSSQDRDIKKLKRYANKLGLKVYIRPYSRHTGAAEYSSGKFITLFVSKTTKTDMILSLLHELGHHLDWLQNKRITQLEQEALTILNSGPMVGPRPDLSRKHRAKILQIEKAGVKYMSKIHKLLKLEIPFYKVKHQQAIDLFDYKFLYHHGRFATHEEATNLIYKKVGYYKKKYGKRKKRRI